MNPAATSRLIVVLVVLPGVTVAGIGIAGTTSDVSIESGTVGDVGGLGDDPRTQTTQRYGSSQPQENLQPDEADESGDDDEGEENDSESDDSGDESDDGDSDDEGVGGEASEDNSSDGGESSDDGGDEDGGGWWGGDPWWSSGDDDSSGDGSTTDEANSTPSDGSGGTPTDSGGGVFDDDSPFEPTETPSPASFRVTDATLDRDEVRVGEPIAATATVENRGDRAGTYDVELRIDGGTVATDSVPVEGGDAETVTVRTRVEQPGTYDVSVGDTDAGTLSVTRPDAEVLEVVDASVPAEMVQPGVEVTAQATVENPSDREIDPAVNVTVDGEPVAESEVSIAPGERTNVTIPFEATGGTVAVGGVEAGRLQVDESVGGDEAAQPTPNEAAGLDVGFGLLAAAVIVAGALLVVGSVRWRSDGSMLGNLEDRRR